MKRILICLALAGSAFAHVRVVPPIPTNLTPVTLYFNGGLGCPIYPTGAAVQRVGESIRLHLGFDRDCIFAVAHEWQIAVPLGALEPGHYEIFADSPSGAQVVQFDVLDATTFPITPPGIHVNDCGGAGDLYAPDVFDEDAELRFGNGTAVVHPRGELGFFDCAEPGLKDLEVTTPSGETLIARNGFTVYEGSGRTHPYVYEDVLVPIYLNGRGASGDWRTELAVHASDSYDRKVPIYAPWGSLEAGLSRSVIAPADIGNRGNGFFLRVARNGVERFRPELRVWNAAVSGVVPTRLPVVRERDWLAGVSVVESLPAMKGTRVTVRVYSPEDDSVCVGVVTDGAQNRYICPTRASADAPRFESYEFIVSSALGLRRMTFSPDSFGSRYWVMVTLTDDLTGQVIVLTPQPEETRR